MKVLGKPKKKDTCLICDTVLATTKKSVESYYTFKIGEKEIDFCVDCYVELEIVILRQKLGEMELVLSLGKRSKK